MSFLLSPIFGSGIDGDLVISSNTTDAPIDAAFTGTAGTLSGSGTNASFAVGQVVFIHQTIGTGYGQCERNVITGYSSGTITFSNPLSYTYIAGAQILVVKQYRSIAVNAGVTWSAKAWNGTVGGILFALCSGTTTINGTISTGLLGPGDGYSTNNQGFRGATTQGGQGEGVGGLGALNSVNTVANGTGGGGGNGSAAGAGGGGHSASGTTGSGTGTPGVGGSTSGSADLLTMTFGGGGGRGGGTSGEGGYGGGLVIIMSPTIIVDPSTGFIKCNGSDGQAGAVAGAGGGGGAGGSILLVCKYATLGTGRVLAQGGLGGATSGGGNGGPGANGRIAIAKGTILDAGTTTPSYTDRGYQIYCGTVGRG